MLSIAKRGAYEHWLQQKQLVSFNCQPREAAKKRENFFYCYWIESTRSTRWYKKWIRFDEFNFGERGQGLIWLCVAFTAVYYLRPTHLLSFCPTALWLFFIVMGVTFIQRWKGKRGFCNRELNWMRIKAGWTSWSVRFCLDSQEAEIECTSVLFTSELV